MRDRYLLDRVVLQALENPKSNQNVRAWLETVDDDALYVSAITIMEGRKGFAKLRLKPLAERESETIRRYEAQFDELLSAFDDRVLPVDRPIAEKSGEMLAERDANILDTAVAATAAVRGMIIATRNLRDFRGRGVGLIDPFRLPARLMLP